MAAKRAQQERLTARPVRFNARVLEEGEELRRLLLANARSMTGDKGPEAFVRLERPVES